MTAFAEQNGVVSIAEPGRGEISMDPPTPGGGGGGSHLCQDAVYMQHGGYLD